MKKLRMCLYMMFMFYACAIASAVLCHSANACDMIPLTLLAVFAVLVFGVSAIGALCFMVDEFIDYRAKEHLE